MHTASALSAWHPAGGTVSDCAQERQQASFGLAAHGAVDFGMCEVAPTNQPTPSSRIEQSFSSDSITIATSESGRRNAARWASNSVSRPLRTVALLTFVTVAGGSGSIRKRYQDSSDAS